MIRPVIVVTRTKKDIKKLQDNDKVIEVKLKGNKNESEK